MPKSKLYRMLGLLAVVGFIYVLGGEVIDRWKTVYQLYEEYTGKQHAILNPAELNEKRNQLQLKKKLLSAALAKESSEYEQSQAGLIDYLSTCANKTGIQYQSLQPTETKVERQTKRIGFAIDFNGGYHQIGKLINALETGSMNVEVKSLIIFSKEPTSPILQVKVDGDACIVSRSIQQ